MKRPNIVILTGAGISAESGIATFRASDGLWEQHHVEDVATPEGFIRNPDLVQRFYNERRAELQQPKIQPNAAHQALVKLEEHITQQLGGKFMLVTQNIDDLHKRAGNQNIIAMHGELLKVRCVKTDRVLDWRESITDTSGCACCKPSSVLRPHIVWFGEMPLQMDEIYQALDQATHFISIGTSGNVYPAAGFVQAVNSVGAHSVELNLEPSLGQNQFKQTKYGPATQVVPQYVDELIAGLS